MHLYTHILKHILLSFAFHPYPCKRSKENPKRERERERERVNKRRTKRVCAHEFERLLHFKLSLRVLSLLTQRSCAPSAKGVSVDTLSLRGSAKTHSLRAFPPSENKASNEVPCLRWPLHKLRNTHLEYMCVRICMSIGNRESDGAPCFKWRPSRITMQKTS